MPIPRFRWLTQEDIWRVIFNREQNALQVTDDNLDNSRTGQSTDPTHPVNFITGPAQDRVVGDGPQTNFVLVPVAADRVAVVKSIMFSTDTAFGIEIKFRNMLTAVDGARILALNLDAPGILAKDYSFGEIARGEAGESVVMTYTPAATVKMNVRGYTRLAPEGPPA